MSSDSVNFWMESADRRAPIVLVDRSQAHLFGIQYNTGAVKIVMNGRHYNLWAEHVALIWDEQPLAFSPEPCWVLAQPWAVKDQTPLAERVTRVQPSKSWLKPLRVPLHPSQYEVAPPVILASRSNPQVPTPAS